MTLYSHFKSKDDLIAAYLCRRDEQLRAWFESAVGRHAATSRDHVAAWFAALKEWFDSPGFRGCAFINATAELPDPAHPGRVAVANHKRLFTDLVADSLRKARVKNPRAAAKSVVMLIEGAIVAAARAGSSQAAAVAHAAARKLLGQRR
jgi:AcrR family transcriptional regulator